MTAKPKVKPKPKPGDVIIVKVGGKDYETVIDEHGVQRFRKNTAIYWMWKQGMLDLNKLAMGFGMEGSFTKRDYAEFNMMIGYSVAGFCDLSFFEDYEIENPLWEE